MTRTLSPIAAFDILADGQVRPVEDPWPASEPAADAAWRWLHCERTDPGFVAWSAAHLPPAVRAGLLQADARPNCEPIGDGLLLSLRGMNLNPGQEAEDMVAIRLWIDARLVVTTRLRRIYAMDDLRADIEAGRKSVTPAGFVARFTDHLLLRIETATREREDATDGVEEELLDDHPDSIGPAAIRIARLAQSVIKLRRYIAPQREALSRLASVEAGFIGAADRYELSSVANRTARAVEELDMIRDRLASLRAHADSVQAAQQARNGFVLSVAAAVFLPLGFLTGLFGMNVAGMPGTEWPWAFVALTAAMGVLGLCLWLLFRWLRWF